MGIAGCKGPLSEANAENRQMQGQLNSEALILKEGGNQLKLRDDYLQKFTIH